MTDYVKTPLAHRKLALRGVPYTKESYKAPQFVPDIFAGNPQLVAWIEHPDEENKTDANTGKPMSKMPLKASTSWPRLRSLLEDLKSLIGNSDPIVRRVETLTVPADENGDGIRTGRTHQAYVYYGRMKSGHLFISLENKDRPKATFIFEEDSWHNFSTKEEDRMKVAAQSDNIAVGYIDTLIETYQWVFTNNYDPNFVPKGKARIPPNPVYEEAKKEAKKDEPAPATEGW